jgi:hypothetical protein
MEKEKVQVLIDEIKGTITQVTSSRKDEVRVMRAMMNDSSYEVGIYSKEGKVDAFNPSKAIRTMVASAMSGSAKIPQNEASALMENYEFKRAEAEALVDVSKEFINTYVHCGRKIQLGGREKSDVSLSLKEIEAGNRPYPKQVGVDANGNKMFTRGEAFVPGYESLKVYAPCPTWVIK